MKKRKLIAIVGSNGLPGRYGGWDKLLENLCDSISKDNDVIVYTTTHNKESVEKYYNGAEIRKINLNANGWQSIPYDILSIIDAIKSGASIILVLGTSGCIVFPFLKLFKPTIILNPDGAEWERGKWNFFVKRALKLFNYLGIKFSDVVISDNSVISESIYKIRKKNVRTIEYGGDHVCHVPLSFEISKKFNIELNNYAFKVCRIVPENNVELILEVFSKIKVKFVLIGNWEVSSWARNLKEKFSIYENLILIGPIYDQNILDQLRSNCKLYIHGHSVGGTNPSLVEAMFLKLPIFCFDVSYNHITTNNSAIYFKDNNDLTEKINKYWSDNIYLDFLSKSMYRVASERYTWTKIIASYRNVMNLNSDGFQKNE